MKKLIILALILAAGLTAYPQSSRSSREAKSSKGSSSQVASRSSSKKSSAKVSRSTNSQSRSKAISSRSSNSSRSAVNRSSSSRSAIPKATKSRSSSSQSRSNAVKSGSSSSRTSRSQVGTAASSRSNQSVKSSSGQRTSRSAAKKDNKNVLNNTTSRSSVPSKVTNSERSRSQSSAVKSRSSNSGRESGVATSSFSRSDRKGNKTYVSNDGRKYRHQNDEVFTRNRYRTDYRDIHSLRRSRDFIRVHDHYYNWYSRRHIRRVVVHNHFYHPLSIEIRRVRYPYRRPVHLDLCWTPHLHHSFVYYYPLHSNWNNISYGDYIETASSYEAMNYVGSVKRIYGKVEEVYYSPEDRTYTLYFGAQYPYHDFSVVIPRDVAKSFSWSPSWYFEGEHVWVVGLIEEWEGKPEIVLHDEQQIRRY